ncbi:MAG: hypothetical protein QOH21_9 [Acidobacteriota bacterium]|nr:hypothetical protein [Acidobacteriota bacterium]
MVRGFSKTTQPRDLAAFTARCLSLAGHPFFVIPLTVAFATRSWRSAAVIAATTTLPLTLIIARKVRRGTWSDADVSRRDQRSGLYFVMIPLLALTGLVLHLTGASPDLMRGIIAGAILLAAGLLANRFLKVSMHMMFDAYCALIIFSILPPTAPFLAIFVAAVAWSRHKLDRHTLPEILTGIAIGAAVGWWAAFG